MIFGTGVLIRRNDGKILIGRRSDGKGWCGGGGHIEAGETPRMAAYRETVEEMGVYPIGMKELGELNTNEYQSYIFLVENFFGEPRPADGEMDMLRWVDPVELPWYDLFEPFQRSLSLLPAASNEYSFHYSLDPKDQPEGVLQYDELHELEKEVQGNGEQESKSQDANLITGEPAEPERADGTTLC